MGKQTSISYREIDNGYLLTYSGYDESGYGPLVEIYCRNEAELGDKIGELVTDDLYPE